MFDLVRHQRQVVAHFKKYMRGNEEKVDEFIQMWIDLLKVYSEQSHFLAFDPRVPLYNKLSLRPRGVLICCYGTPSWHLPKVSVLSLYPYSIRYKHTTRGCAEGLQLIIMYLKAMDINIVGFYKIPRFEYYLKTIREALPSVKAYSPMSFDVFCRVCRSS